MRYLWLDRKENHPAKPPPQSHRYSLPRAYAVVPLALAPAIAVSI
jgi:hypothetical protein